MTDETETFEGYVIDQRCITTNARDELLSAAEDHSREWALAGKCMESSCGLVNDEGGLLVLDSKATPKVVETLASMDDEGGIRLRVGRAS